MPSSVDLGKKLEQTVNDLIKSGRYNSRSEVLREGVRLVEEREARLAALDVAIARGVADGDASRINPAASTFDRLSARYSATTPTKSARRPSTKKR
jgi:antitoxin ParD1/3/4